MTTSWAPAEFQTFRRVLRQGGTFVDVGIALSRSLQEVWEKAQEIGFHQERKERSDAEHGTSRREDNDYSERP
jgi:hypothetical protein